MSILAGATNVVVKDSQLIHYGSDESKGAGLKELRSASIPGAAHDSSERYPPPICHPGTREDYIEQLTQWGLNTNNHAERIMWVKGPAGVGKSAIAQSCAEALHSKKKLGATFFFSRPNHRDDPDRFFIILASQLAGNHNTYGAHLDHEIQRNPDLVRRSLPHQFRDLLFIPFTDPTIQEEVGEQVIIVDGFDECASKEAQAAIIKIVAESVRAGTTSFLWIFLSRLEPKLVKTFDLPDVKSVSQETDLPVSRELDQQILRYLADKLQEIGREHDLPLPWPSEKEVWALVDFSAGLFACAHAVILFIGAEDPAGPVELLHVVLQLAQLSTTKSGNRRLSALDELYTLVMERVPPAMLKTVQWILLTTRIYSVKHAHESANLPGLSELQLRTACGCLHSVMEVRAGDAAKIAFFHASFTDFLEDPARSGRFYIWSDWTVTLLEEVFRHLDKVQVGVGPDGQYFPQLNLTWPNVDQVQNYFNHLSVFFAVLYSAPPVVKTDKRILRVLADFDFKKFSFYPNLKFVIVYDWQVDALVLTLGSRLLEGIRPCLFWNFLASFRSGHRKYRYRIGNGKKAALVEVSKSGYVMVKPYSARDFERWAKQSSQAYTINH